MNFLAVQIKGESELNKRRPSLPGTGLSQRAKHSCSAVPGQGLGIDGMTSLRGRAWPPSCLGPAGFGKQGWWSEGKANETFAPAKRSSGTFFLLSAAGEPAPFLVCWSLGSFAQPLMA